MKNLLFPILLSVALPAFGQTVAIDRQGNVQNAVVKFDGTAHTIWVDGVEITGAAMTDARVPLAHAASHASAGSDPLTLAMTQITGLVAALAGKSDIAHTHTFASLTSKPTTIDGYGLTTDFHAVGDARWALLAHTHAQSDVTNLVSDLAGKVPTTRTVNGQPLSGNILLTTADVADSLDKRYVTDAQRTVIQNTSGTNTGDQTITLMGDVTGSGTGSFPATIANNAVSLAKLADMATDSFLGRDTAGTGDPEVLSIATVKDMLNLAGTNSGDQIVPVNTTATASQFFTAYNSGTGGFTKAQPAFSDLSGSINDGQIPAEITRDAEWNTVAKIETATSANLITSTEIDTTNEVNALMGDADFALTTHDHNGVYMALDAEIIQIAVLPDPNFDRILFWDDSDNQWKHLTLGTNLSITDVTLNAAGGDDTAFASSWNGVTGTAPSKNALYDWGHIFDTDDNGKVNVLDLAAGIPKTDSSGVLGLAVAGTDYVAPTGIDTTTEINALTTDADFSISTHTHTSSTLSGIDISDDTNLAGTASEITVTGDTISAHAALTRDAEWDTAAEINAATTDDNFVTLTGTETLTNKTITQSAWTAPTFINSWVNFESDNQTAGYFKDSHGVVHLRGLIKSGTIGTNAFVLPAGFRPTAHEHFGTASNDAYGQVYIVTDGSVGIQVGNNTWVSLNGISFRTN